MEPRCTFSTATYFPSQNALRGKRDAGNNYTRWQRPSQSNQDIVTLTTALSPHSLNFHVRVLKARFMSYTFTRWAWSPAQRRCSINQQ